METGHLLSPTKSSENAPFGEAAPLGENGGLVVKEQQTLKG